MKSFFRSNLKTTVVMAVVFGCFVAAGARADSDPWSAGSNWLALRAGYAKASTEGAGGGGYGYGFGYSHLLHPWKLWRWTLFKNFGVGLAVERNVIGQFNRSAQIEIPATVELVRHFHWKTTVHPYFGVGAGSFYRKTYRTGDDLKSMKLGGFAAFGANAPLTGNQAIGIDTRWVQVDALNDPANPVFGAGSSRSTHWGLKVTYAIVY